MSKSDAKLDASIKTKSVTAGRAVSALPVMSDPNVRADNLLRRAYRAPQQAGPRLKPRPKQGGGRRRSKYPLTAEEELEPTTTVVSRKNKKAPTPPKGATPAAIAAEIARRAPPAQRVVPTAKRIVVTEVGADGWETTRVKLVARPPRGRGKPARPSRKPVVPAVPAPIPLSQPQPQPSAPSRLIPLKTGGAYRFHRVVGSRSIPPVYDAQGRHILLSVPRVADAGSGTVPPKGVTRGLLRVARPVNRFSVVSDAQLGRAAQWQVPAEGPAVMLVPHTHALSYERPEEPADVAAYRKFAHKLRQTMPKPLRSGAVLSSTNAMPKSLEPRSFVHKGKVFYYANGKRYAPFDNYEGPRVKTAAGWITSQQPHKADAARMAALRHVKGDAVAAATRAAANKASAAAGLKHAQARGPGYEAPNRPGDVFASYQRILDQERRWRDDTRQHRQSLAVRGPVIFAPPHKLPAPVLTGDGCVEANPGPGYEYSTMCEPPPLPVSAIRRHTVGFIEAVSHWLTTGIWVFTEVSEPLGDALRPGIGRAQRATNAFLGHLHTALAPATFQVRLGLWRVAEGTGSAFWALRDLAVAPYSLSKRLLGASGWATRLALASAAVGIGGYCVYRSGIISWCYHLFEGVSAPDLERDLPPLHRLSVLSAGQSLRDYVRNHFHPRGIYATRDPFVVWCRMALGLSGYFSTASLDVPTKDLGGVVAVLDSNSTVSFHGFAQHTGQIAAGVPRELPPCTWRCGPFARHSEVDVLPPASPMSEVIKVYRYLTGPVHYCDALCPRYHDAPVSTHAVLEQYGSVRIVRTAGEAHIAWSDSGVTGVIPLETLNNAVSVYHKSSNSAKGGNLSLQLIDYRNLIPLVQAAIAGGLGQTGAPEPFVETTYIPTTTSTLEVDGKLRLTEVHNALLKNSVGICGAGRDAAQYAIHTRIRAPATNTVCDLPTARYMREFASLVTENAELSPMTLDELAASYTRPIHHAQLESMGVGFAHMESSASTFLKAEPTNISRAARIIVPIAGPQNHQFSRWTKPLSAHLATLPFWCPGKSCGDIQDAVHRIHVEAATAGLSMVEGDYAGFDGTTGGVGHALLHAVLCAAYPDMEWQPYTDFLVNPEARCKSGRGFAFTMGNGTISGSADTTLKNTLLAAFVVYCYYRREEEMRAAWALLLARWLLSGDDSAGSGEGGTLISTAADLGLKLEASTYSSGPTRFLGRFYPAPFTSRSCIADVPRFIKRMHIVALPPDGDAETAMAQCALGRLVNDTHTPLLTAYCHSVVQKYKPAELDSRYFDQWKFAQLTTGGTYTCEDFSHADLLPIVALDAGIPLDAIVAFEEACSKVPTAIYRQFTPFSTCVFTARPGTVVGGIMHGAPLPPPDISLKGKALAESRSSVYASIAAVGKAAEESVVLAATPVDVTTSSAAADAAAMGFSTSGHTAAPSSVDTPVPPCAKCNSSTHVTANCSKCSICKGHGHLAKKCTACYHCRLPGAAGEHLSKDCTSSCARCQESHPGTECPAKPSAPSAKRRGGKPPLKGSKPRGSAQKGSTGPRRPKGSPPSSSKAGGGATSSSQ